MKNFILFFACTYSLSLFAVPKFCSYILVGQHDKILAALMNSKEKGSNIGFISAFHVNHGYGNGYLSYNSKTGRINYGENGGKSIDNVSYPYKDIAMELPSKVEQPNEVQSSMPFLYQNKIFKTRGQFADGSFFAVEANNSINKITISYEVLKAGVQELSLRYNENLAVSDTVDIDKNIVEQPMKTKVLAIEGMYA